MIGKRSSDGVLVACASSCLDVLPKHHLSTDRQQPVLSSIENLPAAANTNSNVKSPRGKKQRCLELDQGHAPLDASALFSQARSLLRQPPCNFNEAPVGRDQQFQQLTDLFEEFNRTGCGSSIYVSGLPGTGKSHTVRKTLQHLLSASHQDQELMPGVISSPPAVTWVNCMSVSCAGGVYAQVAAAAQSSSNWQQQQQLEAPSPLEDPYSAPSSSSSATFASEQAADKQLLPISYQQLLDNLRTPKKAAMPSSSNGSRPAPKSYKAHRQPHDVSSSMPHKRSKPQQPDTSSSSSSLQRHIVVLDEIDNIAQKSIPDLVQLFSLPHEPGLQLLLVGIANSIDLTERTLPQLKLHLVTPKLLTFPAYTAKQLGAILETVVQQLPCKLFEPAALQLCSRSVGTSSGDLRHALKACRAALDELEQQQQQQQDASQHGSKVAAVASAPALQASVDTGAAVSAGIGVTVGVRHMSTALSRLAGVRSSQFGAQATSIIRTLPNQQQLLLYALSILCQQPAAAIAAAQATPEKAGKAAASSLWKAAGSAAQLTGQGSSNHSSPLAGLKATGSSSSQSRLGGSSQQAQGSVFVLAVSVEEAFVQYQLVCKLLKLPACSRGELLHMAELLSQMALVDVIHQTPSAAAAASNSGLRGAGSRAGAGKLTVRGRSSGSKLGGLAGGGRGVLGGAGGSGSKSSRLGGGGGSVGAGAGAVQQTVVRLSVRASSAEVSAALKHNPALRCLVDA